MFRLLTWAFLRRGEANEKDKLKELHEQIRRMEEQLAERDGKNQKTGDGKPQREPEMCEPTNCFQKTGRVTAVNADHVIIDSLYFVPKSLLKNCVASECIELNSRLSYLAYRKFDSASGESAVKVVKIVSVIDEMWTEGGLPANESLWEEKESAVATANGTVYYKGNERREPGKVIAKGRDELTVETDAGDPLNVNMDKTRMSFVPMPGDYVTLDCLVQMDNEFVDFKGEVLEVVAIEPSRTVSGTGRISTVEDGGGEILTPGGRFVYQMDCLADSYRPSMGDVVSFQAIENEIVEMRCLRVKLVKSAPVAAGRNRDVIGSQSTQTSSANRHDEQNGTSNNKPIWKEKHGIRIVGDFEVNLKDVQEIVVRTVNVKNESKSRHRILRTRPMKNSMNQLVQLKSPSAFHQPEIILFPGESVEYVFNIASSSFYGRHREAWVWEFGDDFKISRTFQVTIVDTATDSTSNEASSGTYINSKLQYLQHKLAALNICREYNDVSVIPGQQLHKRPNFIAFQLPTYTVPPDLFELVLTLSTEELSYALTKAPYCLNEPLSARTYARLFGHLIFLEEINQFVEFRRHDIARGHFTREDSYLALHVQSIAETRPSLMIGDSVNATAPWNHEGKKAPIYQGVIHKVLQNRVLLKFEANFHATYNGESYCITFSFTRSTYRKQHHAIARIKTVMGLDYLFPEKIETREAHLNVRLNDRDELELAVPGEARGRVLAWRNEQLNHYQKVAIMNVLRGEARPQPYVIFGPPGTGKTVTTIELVHQLALNSPDCRLVVGTPSNSAANLITERLAKGGVLKPGDFIRLVAINQVERELIPEHLAPYCATVDVSEDRSRVGELLTTESGLQLKMQAKHIGRHRVTISTCSCIALLMQLRFPRNHFTHVIIDEAGQSLEPETLIPITLINRNVGSVTLVGDPKQLGPVVLATEASNRGYGTSLLERILCTAPPYGIDRERFSDTHGYDPRLVSKLCINYRSIPSLLSVYSDLFYDSQLVPERTEHSAQDTEVLATLHDILGVTRKTTDYGLFFCGIDGTNKQSPDSPSWFSPAEACMVHKIVEKLYRKGYQPSDIGIITPYVMQVKTIRRIFDSASLEAPKVGSVEEFQGQERKVVVLSTVRSSHSILKRDKNSVLGFISTPKRVTVALSRAKVALVVVGNPKLLAVDRIWIKVLQRAIKHETYVGCSLSANLLAAAESGLPVSSDHK